MRPGHQRRRNEVAQPVALDEHTDGAALIGV
jgi:hypothetical protein